MNTLPPCEIVELRQYVLYPGRRDELIELFDSHFVESQEDVGMHVIGQFRDVERADHFVWFRGYPDMASRRVGLAAFYFESEAWATHGRAANATMIDSDDVLLLRPIPGLPRLCDAVIDRPAGHAESGNRYAVGIHHLADRDDDPIELWHSLLASLHAADVEVVGVLCTEPATNNFPQLPVREDANVLVVVTRGADTLAADETLLLTPTARSTLR